jgi:hypothetical protein
MLQTLVTPVPNFYIHKDGDQGMGYTHQLKMKSIKSIKSINAITTIPYYIYQHL